MLIKHAVLSLLIYGIIPLIISVFINPAVVFTVIIPVLGLLAIFHMHYLRKHYLIEVNTRRNWIILSLLAFLLALIVKIASIILTSFPLEKAFDFSIAFIVALYCGIQIKYTSGDSLRDVILGVLIYFVMFVSMLAPIWVTSILLGSKLIINVRALIAIIPFAFMVGLGEETLFRGLLQEVFVRRYGVFKGILTSSFILFILWHVVWYWRYESLFTFISFLLYSGFIGIVLGVFYEKYKALLPVIIAHAIWDTMFSSMSVPPASGIILYIPSIVISAIIYITSIRFLGSIKLGLFS